MPVSPDLLASAQSGHAQSLHALLLQLQPDIRRYARRQCHATSVLEDVVQEALIIVYRRVGTVRSAASLSGWLFSVVGRVCMLPGVLLIRGAQALDDDDGREVFARVPVDDLRIDVVRALESLPEKYRQIVLWRDFEELTIGEIAARTQLTREAVKGRLHRARVLVREYLGKGSG